jgi:hypothetical protein
MSRRTIPSKTVLTCDRCQQITEDSNHRIGAHLVFEGSGLDFQGIPVCSAGWDKDLCDKCWMEIEGELNQLLKP